MTPSLLVLNCLSSPGLGRQPWCAVRVACLVTAPLPICSAVSEIPQYSQLVLNVCETLQEEVIALFDQTRHSLASGSAAEDKDSMETDDCPRPRHKDQRDGVRADYSRCSVSRWTILAAVTSLGEMGR